MNDLTQLTTKEALVIFTGDGLDEILAEIKTDAENFVADVNTPNGRKAMKSKAREVASKKSKLDGVGKDLVTDWKQKAKLVDNARKKSRDFLDEVRDKVRQPVTDWEEVEAKRIEAEQAAAELEALHKEAIEANIFFDKQRDIERREAEVKAKEEAATRAEIERRNKADREEREKKIAEDARIEAEAKAKRDAEAKETARRHEEQLAKGQAARKANNMNHRKKINKEAVAGFMGVGYNEKEAEMMVGFIANGEIKHVTINY